MVVLGITLVLSAMALPSAINATHMFRLHNAATQFSGLAQQARSRSVQDSTYYPVYLVWSTPITRAYVAVNGTTTTPANTDPQVSWNPEVQPKTQGNAPDTAGLKTLFLPSGSGGVTPLDGFSTTNPITFSPMGLPCVPNSSHVCNSSSSSNPTAYWIFFENTVTVQWSAVTITPAGKIQKWSYNGTWKAV